MIPFRTPEGKFFMAFQGDLHSMDANKALLVYTVTHR